GSEIRPFGATPGRDYPPKPKPSAPGASSAQCIEKAIIAMRPIALSAATCRTHFGITMGLPLCSELFNQLVKAEFGRGFNTPKVNNGLPRRARALVACA